MARRFLNLILPPTVRLALGFGRPPAALRRVPALAELFDASPGAAGRQPLV